MTFFGASRLINFNKSLLVQEPISGGLNGYQLVVRMPSIPTLEDHDAHYHGGNQSNASEPQGHVHRAAFLLQFDLSHREPRLVMRYLVGLGTCNYGFQFLMVRS